MFRSRNRETVEVIAREYGMRWIGLSASSGDWCVARTENELRRAGVVHPVRIGSAS